MKTPQLIAHRGYPHRFPENSYAGIEAAIEAGARFVELDVQLASDGTPVLFHDRTLDRVCGVPGRIACLDLKQLRAFSAGEPARFGSIFRKVRIATLAEITPLMLKHPHVHFFIELKCACIEYFGAQEVLSRVRPVLHGLEERCTLISFSLTTLELARSRGLRIGLILENWPQCRGARELLQPRSIFCNIRRLPPAGPLRPPEASLAVYEVNHAHQARALATRGVDLIETACIVEMQRALAGIRDQDSGVRDQWTGVR